MAAEMTSLRQMIDALDGLEPDMALGFASEAGDIGGGYHITELKLADVRSVDCGGRQSQWTEASLQLLDGSGGDWLSVGKVASILHRCVDALPALADVPLSVEFGHGNVGLVKFQPGVLIVRDDRAVVPLLADAALCKPAAEYGRLGQVVASGCCGPAKVAHAATGCCG